MQKSIIIIIFLLIIIPTNLIAQDKSLYFKQNPIPSHITKLPNFPKLKYEGKTYYKTNEPMLPVYVLAGVPLDIVDATFGALNYIPLIGTFTTTVYTIPFALTDKYDNQDYITTHYNFSHITDKGKMKKEHKWNFFPIFNYHWHIKVVNEKKMDEEHQKINQYNQRIDDLIGKYNNAVDYYKECLKNNEEISFINLTQSQSLDGIEKEINRFNNDYETISQSRSKELRYNRHKWMNKEELASEQEFLQQTSNLTKYDNMMVSPLDTFRLSKLKDNLIRYKGSWITPEEKQKNQELEKKTAQELLVTKDETELKALIDEEVLKTVKGEFIKLEEAPLVDSTPNSQFAQITVINNFEKDLDILISGPVSKKESVLPNRSIPIVFNAGEYFLVFNVKGLTPKPLVLSQSFSGGGMYELNIGKKGEIPEGVSPTDMEQRRERWERGQRRPRESGEQQGQQESGGQRRQREPGALPGTGQAPQSDTRR